MNWLRVCALCLALLILPLFMSLGESRPAGAVAPAEEAYFVFNSPPRTDLFVIKLTDPAKIQKARDIISGVEKVNVHVSGVIVKEPACYNAPWSYHLDPDSIGFFGSATEVCDGAMGYIDTHLKEVGGDLLPGNIWCSWGSRLVMEIPPPACNEGVKSFSAASYRRASLAEESIVAAFGADLANQTETATTLPLPTTLAGTTVKIKDGSGVEQLAPLFFVSPTQVNYLVPPGTAAGMGTVTITNANGAAKVEDTQILKIAPGLFTANSDGQGAPAAVALRIKAGGLQVFEPVFSFDPAQNKFVPTPIDLGVASDRVFLVLFGTGFRGVALEDFRAEFDGDIVDVAFAGPAPGLEGVDQINIPLPRSLAGRGDVILTLFGDDHRANKVTINIK